MTLVQPSEIAGSARPEHAAAARDELKESLAQVLNALTGSQRQGVQLAHERVSEDILYAALVHRELKKEHAPLAEALLKNLPRRYRSDMRAGRDQPIYNAVQVQLRHAVADKKLSRGRSAEIQRLAFGKAQLDGNGRHLRRVMQEIAAPSSARPNIEALLDKVDSNAAASRRDVRTFRSYAAKLPLLTSAQIRTRAKLLRQIQPPLKPAARGAAGSGEQSPLPAPGIHPAPLPDAKTIESGPQDFVYQPASLANGNSEVRIPLVYANDVSAVAVFNGREELLEDLRYAGRDSFGRAIFRSERAGSEFGESIILRLHFRQGDNYALAFDPREYQQIGYVPE